MSTTLTLYFKLAEVINNGSLCINGNIVADCAAIVTLVAPGKSIHVLPLSDEYCKVYVTKLTILVS